MVGLDGDRRTAEGRERLDDVGIQRPLYQKSHVLSYRTGFGLEHIDESVSDAAPLLFGVGDAGELLQKTISGIYHSQIDAQVAAKGLLHLLPLVEAQQSVIHEDAGQPVSHCPMH